MNSPLFRMLWWDSVAPLGKPVVPLVYWMLIGSSKASPAPHPPPRSPFTPRRRPGRHQRVPLRGAQVDDPLQGIQAAADLLDHRPVVARLERLGADQHPDTRLPQHIAEFVTAVG